MLPILVEGPGALSDGRHLVDAVQDLAAVTSAGSAKTCNSSGCNIALLVFDEFPAVAAVAIIPVRIFRYHLFAVPRLGQ